MEAGGPGLAALLPGLQNAELLPKEQVISIGACRLLRPGPAETSGGALFLRLGQRRVDHVSHERCVVGQLARCLHHEYDRQMLLGVVPE
jgi:hypothetical protein